MTTLNAPRSSMMQQVFLSQLVICVLASGAWAFRAAVFEHVQLGSPATEARSEVVAKNLAAYEEAAKQAAVEVGAVLHSSF